VPVLFYTSAAIPAAGVSMLITMGYGRPASHHRGRSDRWIRAVLLHAMSDDTTRFYARAGFHEWPIDPMMMMMITLAEVENNLGPPSSS
jgi:hypothetical protein